MAEHRKYLIGITLIVFNLLINVNQVTCKTTWSLTRWKLSDSDEVEWPQISTQSSFNMNSAKKFSPSPEFFQMLQNPCNFDEFFFYTMTKNNGSNNIYMKLVLEDDSSHKWINLTSAFCGSLDSEDCGIVKGESPLLLTNDHLIALTSKGLYVSDSLNESDAIDETISTYKPRLVYKLTDPCDILSEVFTCFDTLGRRSNVLNMRLFYNPVCQYQQEPNFRDTIILLIEHPEIGLYTKTTKAGRKYGPILSFTILFSDAPYDEWSILLKSGIKYKKDVGVIIQIHDLFYNHQLDNFNLVVTTRNHGSGKVLTSRIILPREKSKSQFVSQLSPKGYQTFIFNEDFVMRKMQVVPGSLDVFFYGNHLYIAESAGFLVYQSLSEIKSFEIDSCSFGHPDRYFICTNRDNNIIMVGRVGSFYSPARVFAKDLWEIKNHALQEKWIVNTTDDSLSQAKAIEFDKINDARLAEQLRNSHFTVDYEGNIRLWHLEGYELQPPKDAEYEQSLEENVANSTDNDTEYNVGSIRALKITLTDKKFVTETSHGPLIVLPLDATSALLFEAEVPVTYLPEPTYINRLHAGLNIHCFGEMRNNQSMDCELYIRHVKTLTINSVDTLPGIRSTIFTYILDSIPMTPFHCNFNVSTLEESNKVEVNLVQNSLTSGDGGSCWKDEYVGWTLYILGQFSLLLSGVKKGSCHCTNCCIDGIATKRFVQSEMIPIAEFRSVLINMNTPLYKNAERILRYNQTPLADKENPKAWELQHGECSFNLSIRPNSVIKKSGGIVILDLEDVVTFTMEIKALNNKARVMLQRPLLAITNSNPQILTLDRNFDRQRTLQSVVVVVRPNGIGIGLTSVVVRSLGCSMSCKSQCSFTIIFQLMMQKGRRLDIEYPVKVDPQDILNPDETGAVRDETGKIVYTKLPVNYRPPSLRGPDIPLSTLIYNADPSQPKYKNYYRISKETGEFGRCKSKSTKRECECDDELKLSDHVDFTDCKEMVYLVRRGVETEIKASYQRVMDDSEQNPIYFLKKLHLSVYLEEVNKRTDYTVTSKEDEYLHEINKDKALNLGRRFYDANSISIACFGTGLFHFKVTVGEFDSFGEVSGYFMLFSEDKGVHAVTYIMVLFLTLTGCLLCLFLAFLHMRKRLLIHLPLLHGDSQHAPLKSSLKENRKLSLN